MDTYTKDLAEVFGLEQPADIQWTHAVNSRV